MKTCSVCHIEKDLELFSNVAKSKDGKHNYCKECASEKYKQWSAGKKRVKTPEQRRREREAKRIRLFGLDDAAYDELLREQSGGCAICGREKNNNPNQPLPVDHCHETNTVRGILCHSCNLMLGLIKDRVDVLEKAIEYLVRTR